MQDEMFDSWNLDAMDQLIDGMYDGFCIRRFTLWVMGSLVLEMEGIVENLEKTV